MSTHKIKIGNTDLKARPFVLGGNVFGWTVNQETSFEILDKYVDLGFSLIDTADVYSIWKTGNKGGESETILGNWLNSTNKRSKVILATKVGGKIDNKHKGLKREYVISEVEESLNRLQTDHIDIYYVHFDDLRVPSVEILETFQELIAQGKIRYIGVSNMSPERIEQTMEASQEFSLPSFSLLQPEYNLYNRENYENNYKPLVEKYEFAVFTYYSLASGFLTGKYYSKNDAAGSERKSQLNSYFDKKGVNLLLTLRAIAQEKGITPAQLSLAWLLHQETVTAPISSVSRPEQLDILKATEVKLKEEEIQALNNSILTP